MHLRILSQVRGGKMVLRCFSPKFLPWKSRTWVIPFPCILFPVLLYLMKTAGSLS